MDGETLRWFGQYLVKRRRELELTQLDAARAMGISQQELSKLETGRVQNPPLETLCKVGLLYRISPDQFARMLDIPHYEE